MAKKKIFLLLISAFGIALIANSFLQERQSTANSSCPTKSLMTRKSDRRSLGEKNLLPEETPSNWTLGKLPVEIG